MWYSNRLDCTVVTYEFGDFPQQMKLTDTLSGGPSISRYLFHFSHKLINLPITYAAVMHTWRRLHISLAQWTLFLLTSHYKIYLLREKLSMSALKCKWQQSVINFHEEPCAKHSSKGLALYKKYFSIPPVRILLLIPSYRISTCPWNELPE